MKKQAEALGGYKGLRLVLIVGVTVIFIVSVAFSISILRPSDKQLVEIVSDEKVLYSFDLSETEDREIKISYGDSSNTIRIEKGEIWVQEAECPDQTCVEMGRLYSESLPIVCLPNRLIIRFAE